MLEHRLAQHDTNQLELKLAYPIDRGRRRQRYGLEVFTYVPRTLGVSRSTYHKDRFYEDTTTFVRLKTPAVALRALAEGSCPWFQDLAPRLDALLAGDRRDEEWARHRLKLVGSVFRRALIDERGALSARFEGFGELSKRERRARADALAKAVRSFVDEGERAMAWLRELGRRCEQAAMPRSVTDVWRAVDEYASLVFEEACTALTDGVDQCLGAGQAEGLKSVRREVAGAAVAEFRHRRGHDYPSFIRPERENEALPYRRHILKLIVCSVLFLDVREAEPGRVTSNIIGMLAAAAAMLFAVQVTVWSTIKFEITSMAFLLIAVGSYMVKDRIKDWGKRTLGRRVNKYMPDKVVEVRDRETGARIGTCRETVTVLDAHKVDDEIHRARHIDHDSTAATDGRPEVVIRYSKELSLVSSALEARVAGVRGLNDIIRFNLARFRARMDDPYEVHRIVDPGSHKVMSVRCARVYHVNLVLRFTTGHGKARRTELERVRVILDQRGIKRVERIPASGAPEAVRHGAKVHAVAG